MTSLKTFIVLVLLNTCYSKEWPSQFPRCHRDNTNLNKCMVNAANKMKPFLIAGIPEFDLPSISKFQIPIITIDQGSDVATFKITLRNLTISGFDTYHFDKFDFDAKKLYFDCLLRLGTTHMKSTYEMKGKLFNVPIEGSGLMTSTIVSLNGTLKQYANLVQNDGLSYINFKEPRIMINIGQVKNYDFKGLFDGNEVLAKAADKIMRDNADELIKEVKPAVEKISENIVRELQQKIASKIPYDELFPIRNTL